MFGPPAPLLPHHGSLVNADIVNQEDMWNRLRLERNLIEEGDHIVTCRRRLLNSLGQLAVMEQNPSTFMRCRCANGSTARVWPILAQPYCTRRFGLKPDSGFVEQIERRPS